MEARSSSTIDGPNVSMRMDLKGRVENQKPASKVAVFLDRDGVINEERSDYVKNWGEFRFLPGALQAIASLTKAGLRIFVISNQSMINRGRASLEDVEEIHRRMKSEIEQAGGVVEGILYCPHTPEENCECRKPRSGLLEKAAKDYGVELERSYLIGDKLSDISAGQAVGCHCVLIQTGEDGAQLAAAQMSTPSNYRLCKGISQAVASILRSEQEKTEIGDSPSARRASG